MTTNQTQIISIVSSVNGEVAALKLAIDSFIATGATNGWLNFDEKAPVVTPEFFPGLPAMPSGANWYTVQINYYDPALYA